MKKDKSIKPTIKSTLHPRNRNREPYDLKALVTVVPELGKHIKPNKYGAESIYFASAEAVKLLNQALLNHYYGIEKWDFPDANLCPPIPGRADYLHAIADLLSEGTGELKKGSQIKGLDIGTGASLIYPILGVTEYDWSFIATDIDAKSIASAEKIIEANDSLKGKIELRLQKNADSIFNGILNPDDKIDFTMCNPPFHASQEDALRGTRRKTKNLTGSTNSKPELNFAGISNELITEGGEVEFIKIMIKQSKTRGTQCRWFTTLVSKKDNLKSIYKQLRKAEVNVLKTIPLGTGNKSSRIVAWSFQE